MEVGIKNENAPIIIIGGGPTGLSLALGLARNNTRSILVEKKPKTSSTSKAPVIHVRTREVFAQWGIEQKLIDSGTLVQNLNIRTPAEKTLFSVNFNELKNEAYHPGMLIIEQGQTEKIIFNEVKQTGMCQLLFDTEAIALHPQSDTDFLKVGVQKSGRYQELSAQYVIGCDGASSFVRDVLKLPFNGFTYDVRTVLADVKIKDERDEKSWPRFFNGQHEITAGIKICTGLWRIIHLETNTATEEKQVSKSEIKDWVEKVLGKGDFDTAWSSPFKIHRRASPRFRVGRVILAGDAAHIHSPVGGQGMNAGIQDTHNLAWKLALALSGGDQEKLLDSYEVERQSVVVKKVSGYTNFITRLFLQAPFYIRKFSFFILRRVLSVPAFRIKFMRRISMINLNYRKSPILDSDDELAGRRLPNPVIHNREGKPVRLYQLLSNEYLVLSFRPGADLPEKLGVKILEIGPGGFQDQSGFLQQFTGKQKRWILIRPDAHIDKSGNTLKELLSALQKFPI